jgi:hypothetical protein
MTEGAQRITKGAKSPFRDWWIAALFVMPSIGGISHTAGGRIAAWFLMCVWRM